MRAHHEMRRIAELARELLLETSVWTDIDELTAWVQGRRGSADSEVRPPREWSVAAVVGRGRDDLDAGAVSGWSTIAQLLRDHAERLTTMIDQEFPGQPAERRSELSTVFQAVQVTAKAGDDLAAARQRAIEAHWQTSEEKRAAEDALRAAADTFYRACEWLEGMVMRIEPHAELLAAMEESKARHRRDAEAAAATRRELQAIAARAAGQLLQDAAPSEPYLRHSTLGTAGTLYDIAADGGFAFAPHEELDAVRDWRARIAAAQGEFVSAVEGRGLDMSRTTHWLWVQVNGDGIRELENALQRLEEDLVRNAHSGAGSDNLAKSIERSRDGVRGAVRPLVEKVARLQAHEAR